MGIGTARPQRFFRRRLDDGQTLGLEALYPKRPRWSRRRQTKTGQAAGKRTVASIFFFTKVGSIVYPKGSKYRADISTATRRVVVEVGALSNLITWQVSSTRHQST